MLNSSTRKTVLGALVAPAILAISSSASAVVYVNDTFDSYSNGNVITTVNPGYTATFNPGTSATVSITTSNSPTNSLKLKNVTTDTNNLRLNRDLSMTPESGANPMTFATVSFDYNYNYSKTFNDNNPTFDGAAKNNYKEDNWFYVKDGNDATIAFIGINGGYGNYMYGPNSTQNGSNANDSWQTFTMDFDFVADTITYKRNGNVQLVQNIALDGTVGLGRLIMDNNVGSNSSTHVENTSFVDNVVYSAEITGIPEPTSIALVAAGALMLQRRRRI